MNKIRLVSPGYIFSCMALLSYSNALHALTSTCSNAVVTPVAHYTFNETIDDDTGNHMPASSTPLSWITDSIQGTSGQYIAHGLQLNSGTFLTQAITHQSLSMFIKPTELTTEQVLYDEGGFHSGQGVDGISLILDGSGNLVLSVAENNVIRSVSTPFPTNGGNNGWHHVGYVYDGDSTNTAWLYVDGYPIDSVQAHGELEQHNDDGGLFQSFGNSTVGASASPGHYTGLMDEVTIHSTALTPKNMLDIANGCGMTDPLTQQGTMECTSDGFLVHTTATTKSVWRSVDLISGAYSSEVDDGHPKTINAIGYNVKDDRIWGYNKEDSDGRLSVSVLDGSGNWSTQLIGPAVDLPKGVFLNVGDVDKNGHYYISKSRRQGSGLRSLTTYVIDLDPESATYLTKIDQYEVEEVKGQLPDWAFSPIDNKLYGIHFDSDSSILPRLIQITPSTGGGTAVVNSLGTAFNDGTRDTFGGTYFDDDGYFYVQGNGTGLLYRLDLRDVAGSGFDNANTVIIANGSTSTENDGTRCLSGNNPTLRDFGDIDAVGIKTKLADDGVRHAVIGLVDGVTDLMIGSSIDAEEDATPNVSASSDGADDGVSFASATGGIVTASVTVTNNLDPIANAHLCAWLDADADGTFEEVERQCSVLTSSDTGSNFSWTFTGGTNSYFSRIRLCDTPSANDCTSPHGLAGNGEVEDYLISYNATAASITAIRLDGMRPDQILAQLDIASMSSEQLFGLLSIWNPDVATGMAYASHEELAEALRQHLDPDMDGTTAVLRWETVDEVGTVGFYAERRASQDSQWQRINAKLLPGLIDAPLGGEYMLFDPAAESSQKYQYQLIEQEAWGTQKTYGPYELELH